MDEGIRFKKRHGQQELIHFDLVDSDDEIFEFDGPNEPKSLDGEAHLGSCRFVLLAELMPTTEFCADSKDVRSLSAITSQFRPCRAMFQSQYTVETPIELLWGGAADDHLSIFGAG